MIEDVFILFMTILAERAVIGMINNFWIIAKHRTEIFFTHICMMILDDLCRKKMFLWVYCHCWLEIFELIKSKRATLELQGVL